MNTTTNPRLTFTSTPRFTTKTETDQQQNNELLFYTLFAFLLLFCIYIAKILSDFFFSPYFENNIKKTVKDLTNDQLCISCISLNVITNYIFACLPTVMTFQNTQNMTSVTEGVVVFVNKKKNTRNIVDKDDINIWQYFQKNRDIDIVEVSYTVNGINYRGTVQPKFNIKDKDKISIGDTMVVYYNPNDPRYMTVNKMVKSRENKIWVWIIRVLYFIVFNVAILLLLGSLVLLYPKGLKIDQKQNILIMNVLLMVNLFYICYEINTFLMGTTVINKDWSVIVGKVVRSRINDRIDYTYTVQGKTYTKYNIMDISGFLRRGEEVVVYYMSTDPTKSTIFPTTHFNYIFHSIVWGMIVIWMIVVLIVTFYYSVLEEWIIDIHIRRNLLRLFKNFTVHRD